MISFGHAAYLGIGAYAVGIPAHHWLYGGLDFLARITENMDPYAGMNFASAHYLIALMGILIIINYPKFKEEVFSSNKNA